VIKKKEGGGGGGGCSDFNTKPNLAAVLYLFKIQSYFLQR